MKVIGKSNSKQKHLLVEISEDELAKILGVEYYCLSGYGLSEKERSEIECGAEISINKMWYEYHEILKTGKTLTKAGEAIETAGKLLGTAGPVIDRILTPKETS